MRHFADNIINQAGVPVSGASVTIFATGTQTKALIFSNDAGTASANPVTTDALGRFDFYVADGRYDLAVSGPTVLPFTISNVEIADVTEASATDAAWATRTLNVLEQGVVPGAPAVGNISLYSKSVDKRLYYKDETGTEIGPLVAGGGGLTSPVNSPSPFIYNTDMQLKGPNPYVDIRAFGARACNPNLAPCAPGVTATIGLGSPTVATISTPSTFVNGDGVVIYGAGPLNNLTAPGAPTVTNVLAAGGTGTGVTVTSAAGSTTRCYKVVARDVMGGVTAASPETCTSTGQATLGAVTVNITSMTRSGTTVTVTTAAPHPVLVGTGGGEVFIGGGNGLTDNSFRGWYPVASAVDSTHFTWTNPVASTVNGSPASATGGTATFYTANHVTWPAVTNAWNYYIYCGASGAESLCGVSNPQGTNIDTTWDDFANLQSNWQFPSYIPTTPPTSATADNLSTTIVSGAGTTVLTLAAAASTAVVGATLLLDSGPAIAAAGQNFRIPLDPNGNSFVVNGFLDLRNAQLSIEQAGSLVLNETLATGNVRWNGVSNAPITLGGPGAWSAGKPAVTIFGGARPGVYIKNAGQAGPDIRGLTFSGCSGTNGCLLALVEGGFSMNFDTLDFNTGTTANDLMGIGLYLRGSAGQSAASVVMDKVAFAPGNTADGTSHNAGFYCNLCGDVHIKEGYSVHRGNIFSAPGPGGTLEIDNWHINGGGTPFLSVVHGGGIAGTVSLGNIIMDTIAHPCIAVLGDTVAVQMKFGCAPSSSVSAVTGGTSISSAIGPGTSSTGMNTLVGGATLSGSGNGSSGAGVIWTRNDGPISVSPDKGTVFVEGPIPAAPVASLSAGGSLGTHNYTGFVTAVWAGNFEGNASPVSNTIATSGGNQTVTITGSTVSPAPKCYNVYISQDGGGPRLQAGANCVSTPTATFTSILGAIQILSPVAQGGPTMLMPGTQGIATPALTLGSPSSSWQIASNASALQFTQTTPGNFAWQLGSGGFTTTLANTASAARTYTFPDATGNVVLDSATQTLTNKSMAVGSLIPGSNGQCVNTAGSTTVWGSCAGTAGVQLIGLPNTTASLVNANVTTAQVFAAACASPPCYTASAIIGIGKTFEIEGVGTMAPVNTTEFVTLGFQIGSNAATSNSFAFFVPTSLTTWNWYIKATCTLTSAGSTPNALCMYMANWFLGTNPPQSFAEAQSVSILGANMGVAWSPQLTMQFNSASATNTATQAMALTRQDN